MSLILSFFFFGLGAILASFIGVVAARLHTGSGFVRGRSRCDSCNTELSPWALIPILSYGISGGRARCCSARLSFQSPLSELLLGGLFVFAFQSVGLTLALLALLISFSLILALVLYDLAHQILPLELLAIFVPVAAVTGFLLAPTLQDFFSTALTALFIACFFALIHFASRGRAMGLADAPFAGGLALMVGKVALSGLIFSFWIGAVIGIVILLKRPAGSRIGVEVPFAPFLAAGFLLAYITQWNIFDLATTLSLF